MSINGSKCKNMFKIVLCKLSLLLTYKYPFAKNPLVFLLLLSLLSLCIDMNDLSNAQTETHNHSRHCCNFEPIPTLALYILIFLFFLAFGVSIFILVVVHNSFFLISSLFLLSLVLACLIWNKLSCSKNRAMLIFLNSFPESDLCLAKDGQLVKITGVRLPFTVLQILLFI